MSISAQSSKTPNTRPLFQLTLALFLAGAAVAEAGAVDQLKRFIQTRSLSSAFVQTNITGKKTHTSNGQLSISRPDRFRWEYRKPDEQLIVGDGQQVWIYDVELNQVSVREQKRTLGESPAALLAGSGAVERFYTLTEKGSSDGLEWLEAQPKSRDQGFSVIRMGFNGEDLKVMKLTDFTGQTTHIEFSNWTKNQELPAGQFQFTPPKGADVLSD